MGRRLPREMAVATAMVAFGAALSLPGAGTAAAAVPPSVSDAFEDVTSKARYANSTWGWAVKDAGTGETLMERNAQQQFVPGSIIKDYTAAAALHDLGPESRFKTRVYRRGRLVRKALRGDLILAGAGDFSFGLRDRPDDTLAFTDFDHNEAGTLPAADLVQGNPLKGLKRLAARVASSGIRAIRGDVIVDNRLFAPYRGWPDGRIDSIWVNENLLDIQVWPRAQGRTARVEWRPHTAAYRVVSRVRTGPPGSATELEAVAPKDGVVKVKGRIAADAGRQLTKFEIPDPARFARTAFVQALRRAGVRVRARTVAPNRQRLLPPRRRYARLPRVAQRVSPPLSEYVKVVLKVSYNRGAQLLGCLVTKRSGSRDCGIAAGQIAATIGPLGVGTQSTYVFDPAGSVDDARTTPADMAEFHRLVASEPYGDALAAGLPVLGRDGSLASTLVDSPAAGHVFAKTGTRATVSPDGRLLLLAQTLVGYIDTEGGRRLSFALMVNGVPLSEFDDVLQVFEDEGLMSAALQQGL